MISERQRLANGLNAARSTGPKTEEGKHASRANAVKHGLSGRGVVLPESDEALVKARMVEWSRSYGRLDPQEKWKLEQMVRESVRVDACDREASALRERSVERAETSWDEDRSLDAEELGRKILTRPSLVARQLESTPRGLDWKIDRWEGLAAVLANGKDWDDRHRLLGLCLLGVPVEFREGPGRLDLPSATPDDLRSHRLGVIAVELERLRGLKDGPASALDRADRDRAARGVDVLGDKAIARVRRYAASCHRRFAAASKGLKPIDRALRPSPPPSWSNASLPSFDADLLRDTAQLKAALAAPVVTPRPDPQPLNRQQRRAMASLERAWV